MKQISTIFRISRISLISLLMIGLLFPGHTAKASINTDSEAREKAARFFGYDTKLKTTSQLEAEITQEYKSAAGVNTPLHIFQSRNNGFVVLARTGNEYVVAAYAPEGDFRADDLPDGLKTMLKSYETSEQAPSGQLKCLKNATVIVEPLLKKRGINLNQFTHPEAGNCPTGCVATAMVQIMAYHQYPASGEGSHCYTHDTYGELCADFENSTYDWENMTSADYQELSLQVGIAMEMDYCKDRTGSSPGISDYGAVLERYFKYHVYPGTTASYYILGELDNERPVYCGLPGDIGHAVVVDGYDDAGYFHVNFGWGGNYNGFYALNQGGIFQTGNYTFGKNISSLISVSPERIQTNKEDSLALLSLHNSLNGSTGWDIYRPVVNWDGIVVLNGRVTEINLMLGAPRLEGEIPADIGLLTELRRLRISGRLHGDFPASIANCTKMLDLSIEAAGGSLGGTLPHNFGDLYDLRYLFINASLEGQIPASIGNMTKLESMIISGNNLSGPLPDEIGLMTGLFYVNLTENKISGNIPESIGNSTNITELHLYGNELSGSIPSSIGNLKNCRGLILNDNQLSGNIPSSLSELGKLNTLKLQDNQLEGSFPSPAGNLLSLKYLDISNNKIAGLPDDIGHLSGLITLDISNNQLSTLPKSLNQLKKLTQFDASDNLITELPENFGSWPELTDFAMANNQLSAFPEEICALANIDIINLSGNRITNFPVSLDLLPAINTIDLSNNDLEGLLPEHHLSYEYCESHFKLSGNRFVFCDIPESEILKQGVHDQRDIKLTTNEIKVNLGDTVRVDIRDISRFKHPDNIYHWSKYPDIVHAEYPESPVLKVVIDEEILGKKFFCKVSNNNIPTRNFSCGVSGTRTASMINGPLATEKLSFTLYEEDEYFKDNYDISHVVASSDLPGQTVSNNEVTLAAPLHTRGTILWQASADGEEWHDISNEMTVENLKHNIVSHSGKGLVLSPLSTAFYRCQVIEENCAPLVSKPVKVEPPGDVLFNDIVNVATEPRTISVDSIEVTLPAGLTDKDFRFTIMKVTNPPSAPDDRTLGTVYEVTASFGSVFDIPLQIKLKNADFDSVDDFDIPAYKPVFFDEAAREWVEYPDGGINIEEDNIFFTTDHLTKLSWYELHHGSYTHRHTHGKVNVIYKWGTETGEENSFMGYRMGLKNFPSESWHQSNTDPDNGGTPALVQDIGAYMDQIMNAFDNYITTPSTFTVYVANEGYTALGHIGAGGRRLGYLNINSQLASEKDDVRSTLAHEYKHYAQGKFFHMDLNNSFWAEVQAPLADRMVWDEKELPNPEPEVNLRHSLKTPEGTATIYDILGKPWDHGIWDPVLDQFFTDTEAANVSSAFLHYMRSYREGTRLDPAKLLTNRNMHYHILWRNYLDSEIKEQFQSTIGQEYDDYVRYLLEGSNSSFSILNPEGNPFSNIIKNSGPDNNGSFAERLVYFFKEGDDGPQVDEKSLTIPYLSSRVLMLNNNTPDRPVVINYTREQEVDPEHRIYYGRYDLESKKVMFEDITDSTSHALLLDAKTELSTKNYQNMSFLLFVNQKCPFQADNSSNFAPNFELEARPVMNITDIVYANVTSNSIHNYSDGKSRPFILSGRIKVSSALSGINHSYEISDFLSHKRMLNDSTYEVNASFSTNLTIHGNEFLPSSVQIRDVSQKIEYDFINQSVKVVQNTTTTDKSGDYTNKVVQETQEISVSDMALFSFEEYPETGEVVEFSTANTTETLEVFDYIDHNLTETRYLEENTRTTSATYVNTNFSSDNVTILLRAVYE